VRDAATLEQLEVDWRAHVLPMDYGLQRWNSVRLSAEQTRRILNGLSVEAAQPGTGLVRAYDHGGQFFAVLRIDDTLGLLRPEKVLADAS
jgi:tRNA U55 pseudouridine synthase TruB